MHYALCTIDKQNTFAFGNIRIVGCASREM